MSADTNCKPLLNRYLSWLAVPVLSMALLVAWPEPSGAASGGPLGDGVARGDRVGAAVEIVVLLKGGVDDRLPDQA